jgi:phosphoglycolate phosphatase-like HAD superfamily hydrolase
MNFEKAIYFDMDGTIADLYGVPNWLPKLRTCDPSPYAQAIPMCDLRLMARYLNQLQREGYTLGVISWLSKEAPPIYDEAFHILPNESRPIEQIQDDLRASAFFSIEPLHHK